MTQENESLPREEVNGKKQINTYISSPKNEEENEKRGGARRKS